ncbi:DNA polymerase kappa-like [Pecten maximus]|uniref:DNA polymerase kappa-like n=1 Tax=Pecten maximus TaxID=6579 RepID=UPI001458865A|nr:DNA polymerase kappa-like [Pecten maximus]
MSCVMEDSNDTTSENKQCDVLGSKTSSTETAKTLYSIESPATFESASKHGFHTIKDLVPEEMSDCLKPKAITVSDVPMNSKDLEQSSMLRDDCGTYKIILCAGSSNSESVTEISKTVEKVNDNGISGDFRKSANDALLWNPASQVCESFDKEENLPDSSKGDNPIHAASPKPYNCPVCQDEIVCDDLSYFNQHIDICLNKKIVMDCSRYRPEEDRKTKLSKTPNSVKKRTPVRKLSGSPSTQKDNRKTKMSTSRLSSSLSSPKMSTPQLTSSLSSPRMGVSCTSDQAVTESKDDNCVDKSMATCTSTNNKLDVPDTGVTSSPLSGVSEGSIDTQKMICPVCFMEQTGTSLDEFNTHVDTCLSKGTITQILQEQRVNTKRLSSGPSPQSVKRKRVDSGSSVPKTKCIDSFFQKVGLETGH